MATEKLPKQAFSAKLKAGEKCQRHYLLAIK
jgi:hypothetical protein